MRFLDAQDGVVEHFAFDHSTGKSVVRTSQDCQAIIDNNRASANHLDGFTKSRSFQRFASIPNSVYLKWMHDDGVDLMTMPKREKMKYLQKKLSDPDWMHLRTNRPAQPYQKGSIKAPTVGEAIRG